MNKGDVEKEQDDDLSRETFNNLIMKMMSGVAYIKVVLTAESKPIDYVFLDINSAFEKLTGLRRERVIGKKATEVDPEIEKDTVDWIGIFGKTAITQESVKFESFSKNLKKWLAIAAFSPRKRYVVATYEDITERKKVEEAFQKRDEIFSKLSTPLVGIGEGIVMVPVIGILDSRRARQLTESVLEHIARSNTGMVVMDISGIAAIDTQTANHILRTVQAVKLMGAEFIITGIRPDVAATLVTLGVDLTGIVTRGSLQEGLQHAYAQLGFKLIKTNQET
jgi:PAS domain S-box-containing protein